MRATSTFSALVSMNGPNKDTFRGKVSDVRKDTRDSERHDALTRSNIVMSRGCSNDQTSLLQACTIDS